MHMPKPPSMRERVADSAKSLARTAVEEHRPFKQMQAAVERKVTRAAMGAIRGAMRRR